MGSGVNEKRRSRSGAKRSMRNVNIMKTAMQEPHGPNNFPPDQNLS
jgi:hypothetical protein